MARGRSTKTRGRSSKTRVGRDKKLTGPLDNLGVIGTGIVGGASTARPIPPMAKPLPGGARPGSRLGGTLRRGARGR